MKKGVTCDRSVVFSGFSGFLHQYNWQPWYNWNIVESGLKTNKQTNYFFLGKKCSNIYMMGCFGEHKRVNQS
jgi:hypothetical protein